MVQGSFLRKTEQDDIQCCPTLTRISLWATMKAKMYCVYYVLFIYIQYHSFNIDEKGETRGYHTSKKKNNMEECQTTIKSYSIKIHWESHCWIYINKHNDVKTSWKGTLNPEGTWSLLQRLAIIMKCKLVFVIYKKGWQSALWPACFFKGSLNKVRSWQNIYIII